MNKIKAIALATPRASFQKPHVREDEDGKYLVRAGSSADACRLVEAFRGAGYECNSSPRDWRLVIVTP